MRIACNDTYNYLPYTLIDNPVIFNKLKPHLGPYYDKLIETNKKTIKEINALGIEGWELVTSIVRPDFVYDFFIFKKRNDYILTCERGTHVRQSNSNLVPRHIW